MSLHLEFEPHSWYKDFAIKDNRHGVGDDDDYSIWSAYRANGMTGYVDSLEANYLTDLKQAITEYWSSKDESRRL